MSDTQLMRQGPIIKQVTENGLNWLHIETPDAHFSMTLFGAHITRFKPKHDNRERLFISENAILDGSKPIRGGIPICWPWFGDFGPTGLPAHGYARNVQWQLVQQHINPDQTVTLELMPIKDEKWHSQRGLVNKLEATLVITIAEQLIVELITDNQSEEAISFTAALHSYFAVSDITQSQLTGLQGEYKDKLLDYATAETPETYVFNGETDRVHLAQPDKLSIDCDGQQTAIFSAGHDSIVVWNPWQQTSAKMADMAADSYQKMLCVETAVTQGQTLAAKSRHSLLQIIA